MYITMTCAPAIVFYTSESLPDNIKACNREFGFGGLLDINLDKLDDRVSGIVSRQYLLLIGGTVFSSAIVA